MAPRETTALVPKRDAPAGRDFLGGEPARIDRAGQVSTDARQMQTLASGAKPLNPTVE